MKEIEHLLGMEGLSRVVFYKELKDRVKTLSLQDAILEVKLP